MLSKAVGKKWSSPKLGILPFECRVQRGAGLLFHHYIPTLPLHLHQGLTAHRLHLCLCVSLVCLLYICPPISSDCVHSETQHQTLVCLHCPEPRNLSWLHPSLLSDLHNLVHILCTEPFPLFIDFDSPSAWPPTAITRPLTHLTRMIPPTLRPNINPLPILSAPRVLRSTTVTAITHPTIRNLSRMNQ